MSVKVENGTITFDGKDLEDLQNTAREYLDEVRPPDGTPAISAEPTPYAVLCRVHGQVFLTDDEYSRQLCRPDSQWTCPTCGEVACWDDDNYESFLDDGPDGPDVHDENCTENCACKRIGL